MGWGWAAIAPRFRGPCTRTLCAVLYSMLEMETSLWFDLACTEVSSVLEDLALGFKIKQKADFQTFSDQDYLKNRLVPTSFFVQKAFWWCHPLCQQIMSLGISSFILKMIWFAKSYWMNSLFNKYFLGLKKFKLSLIFIVIKLTLISLGLVPSLFCTVPLFHPTLVIFHFIISMHTSMQPVNNSVELIGSH